MNMKLFIAPLFITLPLNVLAANGIQTTFTTGAGVTAKFDDGREAQVFHVEGAGDKIESYGFKVSDNTCTDFYDGRKVNGKELEMNCLFEIPEIEVGAVLLWTKNSDTAKIGQRVHLKDNSVELQSFTAMSAMNYLLSTWRGVGATHSKKEIALEESIAPKISCHDYRWLPGTTAANQPVDTYVQRWSSQFNDVNSETGDMEPRAADQTNGVSLKATTMKKLGFGFKKHFAYQAQGYFSYYQFDPIIPRSIYGTDSAMQLTLKKGDSESCYIGLSPAAGVRAHDKVLLEASDADYFPKSITPYIYRPHSNDESGEDEFIDGLKLILDSQSSADFE